MSDNLEEAMQEKKEDGGPAFPVSTGDAANGHQSGAALWQYPGMSLLDVYAAQAMQALVCAAWTSPPSARKAFQEWEATLPPDAERASFDDWIADRAFRLGHSMLAARSA